MEGRNRYPQPPFLRGAKRSYKYQSFREMESETENEIKLTVTITNQNAFSQLFRYFLKMILLPMERTNA
jgi:hypothetical protein